MNLKILPNYLLEQYRDNFDQSVKQRFELLHDSKLSIDTFSFYTSVSAVFSSKIEGEDIDLDSFIKHKRLGAHFSPDHTRKIDDLYNAYQFAQENVLNPRNVESTHAQITQHILQKSQQGVFRSGKMFVITTNGQIEYVAPAPESVAPEMQKLYDDLHMLLSSSLTFEEAFFYASMLHLVFVKIHPFEDGNGRLSRLLEKWFLANKLGRRVWFIQSERYYYENHQTYYDTIRRLGLEYDTLDYSNAGSFLQMLPNSLGLNA